VCVCVCVCVCSAGGHGVSRGMYHSMQGQSGRGMGPGGRGGQWDGGMNGGRMRRSEAGHESLSLPDLPDDVDDLEGVNNN
jgi:hypothetical protein